ncbi:MAG: hypothetical protein ACTSRE_16250 [Promethearchaeota archaeon]
MLKVFLSSTFRDFPFTYREYLDKLIDAGILQKVEENGYEFRFKYIKDYLENSITGEMQLILHKKALEYLSLRKSFIGADETKKQQQLRIETVYHTIEAKNFDSHMVLIVDSEPGLRKIIGKILSIFGISSIGFENPEKSIDYLTKRDLKISLLICDDYFRDSSMNGQEAYDAVRTIYPNLQVIYSSGYDLEEKYGEENFLKKPYTVVMLGEKLLFKLEKSKLNNISIMKNST